MKVVYHPRFAEVYTDDPAAEAGRMEGILLALEGRFELVEPTPAAIEDIARVHTESHIASVWRMGPVYEMALLAAGGAITAAEHAWAGEPAFALVRPPGHHAGPDRCWGFCFFNNVAIALARLRGERRIERALVLDIDLHFGDGTVAIFRDTPQVLYCHPQAGDRKGFLEAISRYLGEHDADIIAVSAGFDRHEADWGRLLKTEDYEAIGRMVRGFAQRSCRGRRFGVLEGGYNHQVLGRNVRALCSGMA
ncbi:MAG: histone deacetylase family protein [Chloroflexota bacterium]|nr:histone deacetylase family protein [Chloroflexota bacterium]